MDQDGGGAEFGRYRLLGQIGEGGMGQVFRARDTLIPRDVAIKVLPPELADQPGYRERFRREAHGAAQLAQPHIVPIYDAGEIDGRLYLAMPIIDGIDMASALRRDGPMSPQQAVRVIAQLASALDAAHARRLVHRDVKPSNVLLTGSASRAFVYLIDFGIAHDSSATKLTRSGSWVGTLSYMSPERFTTGTVDARADIYSLGCVLHECLTGAKPFPGDSLEQQITAHLTADPPRPSVEKPGIPTGFDDIIARAMAKNPDDRYQLAEELADAAERVLVTSSAASAPRPTIRADAAGPPANRMEPDIQTWAPTQPRSQPPPPPRPTPQPGLTPQPVVEWPRGASRLRRFAAALINAIPILAVYFLGVQVVLKNEIVECSGGKDLPGGGYVAAGCDRFWPLQLIVILLILAAVVTIAYSLLNWGCLQGKTGATIGKTVLGLQGRPTGFDIKNTIKVAGPILLLTALALVALFTGNSHLILK